MQFSVFKKSQDFLKIETNGFSISNIRNKNQLPIELLKYIRFVEDFVKVPVILVSVGADRKAVIDMR